MEILSAKCPNCGGSLKNQPSHGLFQCPYCGHSAITTRTSEETRVADWLYRASLAIETDDYNEAFEIFTRVLDEQPLNHIALVGTAISGVRQTVSDFSPQEFVKLSKLAIETTPAEARDETIDKIVEVITQKKFSRKFKDQRRTELTARLEEFALTLRPDNQELLSTLISDLRARNSAVGGTGYASQFFENKRNEYLARLEKIDPELARRQRSVDAELSKVIYQRKTRRVWLMPLLVVIGSVFVWLLFLFFNRR